VSVIVYELRLCTT